LGNEVEFGLADSLGFFRVGVAIVHGPLRCKAVQGAVGENRNQGVPLMCVVRDRSKMKTMHNDDEQGKKQDNSKTPPSKTLPAPQDIS